MRSTRESNPEKEFSLSSIAFPIAQIPNDRMLTTRQVATMLGVSEEALKKWRQRRMRPGFVRYHDGAVRYRLSVILKFMDDSAAK
jgi:DNA-binding transcriptional regulator YiaG